MTYYILPQIEYKIRDSNVKICFNKKKKEDKIYSLQKYLSKIKSCVKLTGFVNSIETFTEQPKVINGASDLMASIFGESGMHTRAAVSTNSLPLGVAVEIDAIFELN